MKIAFLHYHLKPGGVTTVIGHQAQALAGTDRVAVLTGEAPLVEFPCPVEVIPSIAYDGRPDTNQPAEATAAGIERGLIKVFGGTCDLIHVHNPTLIKNRHILKVLHILQARGHTLFLQIHDFAEDGRPDAYDSETPYPANCHYGVINLRDAAVLKRAGLVPQGVHYLPNCIGTAIPPRNSAASGDILYPVRAIRRKNIGEACLLALLQRDAGRIMITLPPNSPADRLSYRDWKQYVNTRQLPILFEAGLGRDFDALLARARYVISTSIAEGFGFAFLEPWTAGKCLWGRQLPEICEDFITNGVVLNHLYAKLILPQDWIGRELLLERFASCYAHNLSRFGIAGKGLPTPEAFIHQLQQTEWIDFGMLDEPLQRTVLDGLQQFPKRAGVLGEANPILKRVGALQGGDNRIAMNRQAVLAHYGRSSYQRRLRQAYASVLNHPVLHRIDKSLLLAEFVNNKNYSLLKWNPYQNA